MSNEVLVRWMDQTTGRWVDDIVGELKNDDRISDLRKAFVAQQHLHVSPALVEVREEENAEKLKWDIKVKKYFIRGADSAATATRETPLLLTLPPPQQHNTLQLPQFILGEEELRNIAAMAKDHAVLKVGSITISSARTKSQNDVLQGLTLAIDGAIWRNKPQNLSDDNAIAPYNWIEFDGKYIDEDHISNRTAYMEHLKKQLHLPDKYSLYDAQPDKNMLNVDVKHEKSGFEKTLKGTTDVVVAETHHVNNIAVRHHIAVQLELKRPDNKGNHEPQVCLEHVAASVLNPNVPVLTGLSNLNDMWTFYWFGSSDDDPVTGVTIKKLALEKDPQNKKLAKYLLESFAEKSNSKRKDLPEGFVDRISWNELCKRLNSSGMSSMHTGDVSPDSPGQKDPSDGSSHKRRDGTGPSRDNQDSTEENAQNKKQKGGPTADDLADSLQLLCPLGDVANELSLLGMMDEDDRVRTVREFIAIHVVPRITGVDPRNHNAEESDSSSSLSAANLLQHDQSA